MSSHSTFQDRIARINDHNGRGSEAMAGGEGTATSRFSSPVDATAPSARRNYQPLLMGLVLGMIVGAIAAGLENPEMPWGPGFEYNAMIVLPTLLALMAGPAMVIAGCVMRHRFPTFFFFAAAYFPAVIATAMVDLPLF
ncbi:hypothetical protein [uncultured Sulfitobacter sp.]|uniref:hypothetical protein n=1 Tax=uncultured Sulfitobacter sp. TaxID=191468 RepID=UPI002632EFD4|nr:hypothetical protein [uncultured Sulfitobacter sp.]